jgi:hypothetical protein
VNRHLLRSKTERRKEVFRRLAQLPPCASYDEMREQLAATLNRVEDEMTPFPFDPHHLDSSQARRPSARMYPVQDDNVNDVDGHPEVKRLMSVGEQTFIRTNGAIEVRSKRMPDGSLARTDTGGTRLFRRAGADGRHVWEPQETGRR